MTRRSSRASGRQQEAGARRAHPGLPVGEIVAAAARAGWRDRWRTLAVAVAVSTVTALLQIVANDLTDPDDGPLVLFTALTATAASVLGTVFLAGFLSRLVGEAGHGQERASVWRVARTLPWARLILADLLVVLIVVAGVLALLIPALVAVTLLVIVGPVIEIENQRVFAALRRSAHLVRRHFWTVALLATLPIVAASEIETIVPHPRDAGEILAALAIRGLGEALAEAAIGLTLVELCYRLIALDRTAGPTPAGDRRPSANSRADHLHGRPRARDHGPAG
jgi:membrane protease YdiL (CAAX protease family)